MPRGRPKGIAGQAPEYGRGSGKANPVDVHVGARVRLRRTLMGLSQEKLGEHLGLTFQQVQKYERGANRISSSKLYRLSSVLDVPVSFFFDDLPDSLPLGIGEDPVEGSGADDTATDVSNPINRPEMDAMVRRETLELVRAYYRISDPVVRKRLFELTKSISNMPGELPATALKVEVAAD